MLIISPETIKNVPSKVQNNQPLMMIPPIIIVPYDTN